MLKTKSNIHRLKSKAYNYIYNLKFMTLLLFWHCLNQFLCCLTPFLIFFGHKYVVLMCKNILDIHIGRGLGPGGPERAGASLEFRIF